MSEPVWSDETPAIIMPSLDEEQEAPTTPTSTWSFSGEDEGEDLPPTTSPIEDDVSVLPNVSPPRASPNTSAPIPIRSPVSRLAELSLESSATHRYGEAISPPDPALIAAATQDSPLGPGVTSDTQLTSGGMLEKKVGGEKITVPADEIVRGVEMVGEIKGGGGE